MQNLESILSDLSQIKTLQDLIESDRFKYLVKSYSFDKVKDSISEDGITYLSTTVQFTERRFDISQEQLTSGQSGRIMRLKKPIASIVLGDEISIRDIDLASVDLKRELVEDLKKIFFNEE